MPTNLIQPLQDRLDELTRQHGEAAGQYEALGRQVKAAQQREADLQQQLKAVQAELAQLGLMQLGRRMMLRAELDNARKKLAANKQLQSSLDGKQQTVRKQLAQLTAAVTQARLALAEAELHAARQEPAPADEQPSAPEAPAQAPLPVSEPAVPVRKPAAPKKPRTQAAAPRRATRKPEADLPLPEQISQLLTELEVFYPEHQVFAPEVLSSRLRDRLIQLTELSGAESPAAFLQAQGWQLIGLQQAKALRQGMYCTPGEEPEVIRPKLNSVLHRLEKHYPDRVIRRSIQHDHKSLAQDVSGLYQWLGYPGPAAMLIAYGFHYAVPSGGRPATNIPVVIGALRTAYPADAKPRTISQIMVEHPEYAGVLKTLQNQAPARFGMSLRQYLAQQGVLASADPTD